MDAELKVAETADGYTHMILSGRLDVDGASAIERKFMAYTTARRHLLVDMAGVSFLGSMGLRILLVAAKALSGESKLLVLFNASTLIRTTLTIAFGNALHMAGDYVAALETIGVARRFDAPVADASLSEG